MAELLVCEKNSYHDSVTLMTLSNKLKKLPGVLDAVVSMATPMNRELLESIGMMKGDLVDAGPNDLAIAIKGESDEDCRKAFESIDELLHAKPAGNADEKRDYHTITEAKAAEPDFDVAVISVMGEFAAREARIALENGMHVMLFSDNVTVEQELEIKQMAHERGLLVMGPDCGTAILGGVGLCFSNKMEEGRIGLVAASGTGLQEVCVLIDSLGEGISQAIGTGGRDLSEKIGGIMMLDAIELLDKDPDTDVIAIISKPPVHSVAEKVIERVSRCTKPTVVCFIAGDRESVEGSGAIFASSLEDAAYKAVELVRHEDLKDVEGTRFPIDEDVMKAAASGLSKDQKYIRGLFCGGTLAAETLYECSKVYPETISNVSKKPETKLKDPFHSTGHCIVDLGDDVFTVGRPHPMIEPTLRCPRIEQEAADPECAIILMDFEIGFGSNEDPAGVTIDAIRTAKDSCHAAGRDIVFIGYVQGTKGDFQGLEEQRSALANAGVIVAESNLQAVTMALRILEEKGSR